MKKVKEIIFSISLFSISLHSQTNIDNCCPPLNNQTVENYFKVVPQGNLNDEYRLQYSPSPLQINQNVAYLNYINSIFPGITTFSQTWGISDAGDGNTPIANPTPMPNIPIPSPPNTPSYENWSDFRNTLPNITRNPNPFFTQTILANRWYRVSGGLWTHNPNENRINRIPRNCMLVSFYFRIQIQGLKRKYQINDGKKIIKEVDLNIFK